MSANAIYEAFVPKADRVLHVCRLYAPKYRGTRALRVTKCADCERLVVVTPKVFRDRAAAVERLGRTLEIVCDDCSVTEAERVGSAIVKAPTAAECAEADRINRNEGRA